MSTKPEQTDNPNFPIQTGSTVLAANDFQFFAGANIGFIGNHTSRLSDGTPTVAALQQSKNVNLRKLFSPEHGAFGAYDEDVTDETDPLSGLVIHSLFGEHKKPTPEMLAGLEYLVFELQDVGARFYTYTATLLLAIDAAFENNIKILVLDRPNPIGGINSDGPLADEISFVAPYTTPIRAGVTLGELALLYARETGKGSIVEIARMLDWRREMYFDQTGIEWIAPSPAMKSINTAIVYPGVCLLEQTNVSVGRGTDLPFEIAGAPYINAEEWARHITSLQLFGVTVQPHRFTPVSSKFAGEECFGIRIIVTDRKAFRSVEFGIVLLTTLRNLYPQTFECSAAKSLLASSATLEKILSGHNSSEIVEAWTEPLAEWTDRCSSCLLY